MVHRGFYAEDNPSILDDDEGSEELAIVNKLLKRIQKEKVRNRKPNSFLLPIL
jgi:hypothetical protein